MEESPGDVGCRQGLASECERFGRFLGQHDRTEEGYEFRERAVEIRASLAKQFPDDPEARALWLDSLNDLAWLLVAGPDSDPSDVSRCSGWPRPPSGSARAPRRTGTRWASRLIATGTGRTRSPLWSCAAGLAAGGTGFDFVFLAMSCWQRGDHESAHAWYHHAERWKSDHGPDHPGLLRFCAEAGTLLGAYESDLLTPGPYRGH